ncbi:MAG: magnesium transporter MgtE N-terminal domain-containing protein, partial [Aestuariivirga sp.]
MTDVQQETAIRDERGAIDAAFIEQVTAALRAADGKVIRGLTRDLHAADLADLIESLDQPDRVALITALGRGFDVEALAELDETVRDELMKALPNEVIASAIKKLDTDDALYLIEDLAESEQQDILAKVPEQDRAALSRGLDYPEETAGRLMQTEFVAVPEFWSIGKTIDHMRGEKGIPENFAEIYVIDPGFHLKGFVPLS